MIDRSKDESEERGIGLDDGIGARPKARGERESDFCLAAVLRPHHPIGCNCVSRASLIGKKVA